MLVVTVARNRSPDVTWRDALPRGYDAALVGAVVFGIAGFLDMVWHVAFGIEVDVGTLLSPTHLGLAIGGGLIITGPLRAAWLRTGDESWSRHLTAVVSLAGLVTLLTFMTQYANPFAGLAVSAGSEPVELTARLRDGSSLALERVIAWQEVRGIFGLLLQAGLVMGPVLMALRRASLRPSDMTIALGLNALVMLLMRGNLQALWPLLAYAIVAGILGDALLLRLHPSSARPLAIRIFATAVPTAFTTGYFLTALGFPGGVCSAWPSAKCAAAFASAIGRGRLRRTTSSGERTYRLAQPCVTQSRSAATYRSASTCSAFTSSIRSRSAGVVSGGTTRSRYAGRRGWAGSGGRTMIPSSSIQTPLGTFTMPKSASTTCA